jgi:hypothetical protein
VGARVERQLAGPAAEVEQRLARAGASMRRIMSAFTRADSSGGASVMPSRSWNS